MKALAASLAVLTLIGLATAVVASLGWINLSVDERRLVARERWSDAALPDTTGQVNVGISSLQQYWASLHRTSRTIQAHAHLIDLFCLVGLSVLLARRSRSMRGVRVLVIGACLYPAGLLLDGFGYSWLAHAVAGLGAATFVAAFAWVCGSAVRAEYAQSGKDAT